MTSVLAFDLGDTLVEYAGLPLSWEAHYPDALARLASVVEVRPTPEMMTSACSVLRRNNTRLAPRVTEVSFSQILRELLAFWELSAASDEFCVCPSILCGVSAAATVLSGGWFGTARGAFARPADRGIHRCAVRDVARPGT